MSKIAHERALRTLPLGVPSSFQHWDPYPMSVVDANGAWLTDVDGRKVLDLSMGFGAVLVGHLHPKFVEACERSLRTGTLFVTPSPVTTEAAERLAARFRLDKVRFTNSGTESLMYAVRVAKVHTGRKKIVKIEGGYHGGYDALVVSVKPSLDEAGPATHPFPVIPAGVTPGEVLPVPFNDLEALEMIFAAHGSDIAAVVMEPVLENIAIVLPDAGYLTGVRELCDRHGSLLIFDEVKTGLTAGSNGAASLLGVQPDLATFAKSIAGGLPVGAFGGRDEVMASISDGSAPHFGTFNGNPLGAAAVIAVDEIVTDQCMRDATTRNVRTLGHVAGVINAFELPAHTVGFGVKGCVTWSTTPVCNYRDYKATDFELAELCWLWMMNRGIATPPGLDDQWLVSLAHTENDMQLVVDAFKDLAAALRA
jgi:glutamate-1-semialdehyde 2,1-aminomutase